jgi:hypothetical protein
MSPTEAARRERQSVLSHYLAEHETSKELNVSVRALRLWRQQRRGPKWIKIGKRIYYEIGALETWLQGLQRNTSQART